MLFRSGEGIGAEKAGAVSAEKVPPQNDFHSPKPRRIALNDLSVTDMLLQSVAEIHNSFLLAFGYSRWLVSKGAFLRWKFSPTPPILGHFFC